jgi:hypothetical protein
MIQWNKKQLASEPIAAQRERRAVSLVEVVTTVVAVAILLGTVLPALATVARDSKSGQCLSNLGRIAHATAIYSAMDPGNMALPVHPLQNDQNPFNPSFIGAYEWGGKSGIGNQVTPFGGSPGPLTSRYGTAAGFGPASRPLNKVLFQEPFPDYKELNNQAGMLEDTELDLPTFRCPSDIGYTGVHFPAFRDEGFTSYDHYGTSYTANMFMTSGGGGSEKFSNSPYLHTLSQIRDPATTLSYYENNGRFAWSAGDMNPSCVWIGPGFPGTVRGWHGADWVYNAAFIDGHVDSIYMRGFNNPDIGVYLDSGFGGSYANNRCIIVRGDGWQKDTLPAARIGSGLQGPGGGRPSWEGGIE